MLFATPLFAQGSAAGGDGARSFHEGRAAFDSGRFARAAELFEQAVKAEPGNSGYHLWLGRAYGREARRANVLKQAGLARRTRAEFERAVALDPDNLDARDGLIAYYREAPGFMGGDIARAHAQASEIEKRDSLRGLLAHGELFEHERKYADAERAYRAAMLVRSERPRGAYALGTLYQNTGAYEKAFAHFEGMLAADPGEKVALYQIGRTGALSGERLDRAQEALERYLTTTPGRDEPSLAAARWRLGQIFERRGDRARARAEYETALRLDPTLRQASDALKKLG